MRTFAIHIWTTKDVARYLEVNVSTVMEWLKRGYLPRPTRVGVAYRWNAALIEKRIPKEWIKLGLTQLKHNLELRVREQFKTAAENRNTTKQIHNLTDDLHQLARQKEKLAKTMLEAEKAGQTLAQTSRRDLFAAHALSGLIASGLYERELARSKPKPGWEHVNFNEQYFNLVGILVREYTNRMIEITKELP
jgi:predicted DNA-binding transcriptional regulator AlpA